jgi:hypothetical protein
MWAAPSVIKMSGGELSWGDKKKNLSKMTENVQQHVRRPRSVARSISCESRATRS